MNISVDMRDQSSILYDQAGVGQIQEQIFCSGHILRQKAFFIRLENIFLTGKPRNLGVKIVFADQMHF